MHILTHFRGTTLDFYLYDVDKKDFIVKVEDKFPVEYSSNNNNNIPKLPDSSSHYIGNIKAEFDDFQFTAKYSNNNNNNIIYNNNNEENNSNNNNNINNNIEDDEDSNNSKNEY